MDLYDEGYSTESTSPATFNFYLTTDTTTAINGTSPLKYDTNSVAPNGYVANGVAAPGSSDSFAASSALYYLGSGTFTPGGVGYQNAFSLSLANAGAANVSAAENYLTSEVKAGGDLRIVVTSNSTATGYLSALGAYSGSPPQLSLNVTSSTAEPNNSTIYLTNPPAGSGNTPTNVTVNLGRVVESYGVSQTFTVGNTSSTGTALIGVNPNGLDGSAAPSGSANPIPAGGTGTVTAGFSASDTNGYEAGYTATGSVTFVDDNNTGSTITVNGSAYVVDQRKITAGGTGYNSTAAISAGKILVGQTGSVSVTLNTTNTNSNLPAGNDEGPDVLTTETLQSGAQSTPYTQKDPFTGATVATLSATALNSFTFNSATPDTNGVTGTVAVAVSGVYGDAHSTTINGVTKNFNGDYTSFSDTAGMTGDGTAGESDYADVYLQWQGYQPAAVSSSPVTVTPNSTATATLTNAATNDNIATVSGVSQNQGLRAGAVITGTGPFNQTWSTGGWSLQSGFTNGTTINGSQSAGDSNAYTTTGTIGFTTNAQMINGTYSATMTVGLENEQDIQGAAPNDLGNITVNVQSTVTSNPSTQSGSYVLNGGTLSAPATNLTGSFTQNGGTATFAKITGSGSLVVNGGTTALASGGGASTVGALTISGSGALDIANNKLYIDYGNGSDPISTIAGYVKTGYNGGTWNGPGGIDTSAPLTVNGLKYALGYADGKDGKVSGLTSGQIEVMYTLAGDANLDGFVNGEDFTILASNFNQNVTGWDQGDFNYDGTVNGEDFTLLAANFNQGVSGGSSAGDIAALDAFAAANGITLPTSSSSVPEPASGVMALFGMGILARRARRRDNR
jgi:MYXO-CTERM domain-containing protein